MNKRMSNNIISRHNSKKDNLEENIKTISKKNMSKYFVVGVYLFNHLFSNKILNNYKLIKVIKQKIVFLDFPEYRQEDFLLKNKLLSMNNFIDKNNFVIQNSSLEEFKINLKKKIELYQNNSIILSYKNDYDLVREIDKHQENYKNINSFCNINNYIDSISIENKYCPICLDKIEKNKSLITDCGHIFCLDCFLNHKISNCPQCRNNLNINKITHIFEGNKYNILKYYNINYLTKFMGTKLTFVIKYIYDSIVDTNVIFLSKNNKILEIISKILHKFSLNNILYSDLKNIHQEKIFLLNYNHINNYRHNIPMGNTTIIFNEIIKNKDEELYILDQISNTYPISIVNIIKFIIRGTKEEDYYTF